MALETLKKVKTIDGFNVARSIEEVILERAFIAVDDATNSILFKIQNGPIKENGVNGCQVDTLIAASRMIIERLNKNFHCYENDNIIGLLCQAEMWLKERKSNREKRNVEGTSQA